MKRRCIALTLILMGCGDRSLEEHNRDKVAEEFSQIQTIEGAYQGDLTSPANSRGLGRMTLLLEAHKKILSPGDQPTSSQQASIKGTLTIEGESKSTVPLNDGFYDTDRKQFQLSVPIKQRDGQVVTLQVSGQFLETRLQGSMRLVEFPEQAISFSLSRTSVPSFKPVVAKDASAHPEGPNTLEWAGLTDRLTSGSKNVFLRIYPQAFSDEERVIDLLCPIKLNDVSIDFGGDVQVLFPNSRWDLRRGNLHGEALINASGAEQRRIIIDCISFQATESNIGWNCKYQNPAAGVLIPVTFTPKANQAK